MSILTGVALLDGGGLFGGLGSFAHLTSVICIQTGLCQLPSIWDFYTCMRLPSYGHYNILHACYFHIWTLLSYLCLIFFFFSAPSVLDLLSFVLISGSITPFTCYMSCDALLDVSVTL